MYRTKKAESERKLTAASSNLERVNDIIGEIEGRIDGLKEDSEKARDYIELRDRNRELEINITLKNIETLEARNRELNAELAEKTQNWNSFRMKKLLRIKNWRNPGRRATIFRTCWMKAGKN